MKYVSFTFDDGRSDNYTYAYPIMKKYDISGTLFCTTGFIDGTWKKAPSWISAESALTIEQTKLLGEAGWEIALHGDQHTTDVQDLRNALDKMETWGFSKRPMGFSMPNSKIANDKLNEVIKSYLGSEISYIRTGRRISTKSIFAKVLFGLYTYGKMQWAYNLFNKNNLIKIGNINKEQVYSVVIRYEDNPDMLLRFLKQIPDNACAVLMFHSIWPDADKHCGADPWSWSVTNFEKFCSGMKEMVDARRVETVTLEKIMKRQS